ncbi:hypothetical protein NXS19_004983 [Fusarium pseudograminearum]|nr:hypothetical protein NXS19_004983 [Fusarium pseudograminearum]
MVIRPSHGGRSTLRLQTFESGQQLSLSFGHVLYYNSLHLHRRPPRHFIIYSSTQYDSQIEQIISATKIGTIFARTSNLTWGERSWQGWSCALTSYPITLTRRRSKCFEELVLLSSLNSKTETNDLHISDPTTGTEFSGMNIRNIQAYQRYRLSPFQSGRTLDNGNLRTIAGHFRHAIRHFDRLITYHPRSVQLPAAGNANRGGDGQKLQFSCLIRLVCPDVILNCLYWTKRVSQTTKLTLQLSFD